MFNSQLYILQMDRAILENYENLGQFNDFINISSEVIIFSALWVEEDYLKNSTVFNFF